MDRRGWPWKKRASTEKVAITAGSIAASLSSKQGDHQEEYKVTEYVQITAEYYVHLTGLEDKVKELSEKLSFTQGEIITKDNEAKQHAKAAEEAIIGWKQAEVEAMALSDRLECVTSLKLKAEDRADNLDGALKECMKKIWNEKQEGEQKLRDAVLEKTNQWEKVKLQLESKLDEFEQMLQRTTAETSAISRSLHECSDELMKTREDKLQADAEIEVLKSNIQSSEKEIISLKYELQVISQELEICNKDKNISIKTAEATNKLHSEDVKKLSKLESKCQRLRGLVKKKLPGPAVLAQMKAEVGSLGRDCRAYRRRQSPGFTAVNAQECHKEKEYLIAWVLEMEEEAKMLKEALLQCNNELQASRSACSKTSSRLHSLEEHSMVMSEESCTSKASSHIGSNLRSWRFMPEDSIYEGSCSESWASESISELSHLMKEQDAYKVSKSKHFDHLELMDDFLEMEMLASLSSEIKVSTSDLNCAINSMNAENSARNTSLGNIQQQECKKQQFSVELPMKANSSTEKQPVGQRILDANTTILSKLQSRIASIFEFETSDTDIEKLTEDIKQAVHDLQSELLQYPASSSMEDTHSVATTYERQPCPKDLEHSGIDEIASAQDTYSINSKNREMSDDMKVAICHIHDFVLSNLKKSMETADWSSGDYWPRYKAEEFSALINKVQAHEVSLADFILILSQILSESGKRSFRMMHDMSNEEFSNSLDYFDKLTLLENKLAQHAPTEDRFPGTCLLDAELIRHSLEELKQLKLEKKNMEDEMAKCTENSQHVKLQLIEMEKNLAELQSQLTTSQNSNSLALTQLKCMAESYGMLETRAHELEVEVNRLRSMAEALDRDLQEERRSHQDDIAEYLKLKEQCARNQRCPICMPDSEVDAHVKMKQEEEMATAAEKLAECRETICILGRQLQALQTSSEFGAHGAGINNATAAATKTITEELMFARSARYSHPDAAGNKTPASHSGWKSNNHKSSRTPSSSSLSEMLLNEKQQGRSIKSFFSRGKNSH